MNGWLHQGSNQHSTVTRQMKKAKARAPARTAGSRSPIQPCSVSPFSDHESGYSLHNGPSSALGMKACTLMLLPVTRWDNSPHVSSCAGLILRHMNLRSPLAALCGRLRKCDLVRGSVSPEMGFESLKTQCPFEFVLLSVTVRDGSSQLPTPVQACYHTSCCAGDGFLL